MRNSVLVELLSCDRPLIHLESKSWTAPNEIPETKFLGSFLGSALGLTKLQTDPLLNFFRTFLNPKKSMLFS